MIRIFRHYLPVPIVLLAFSEATLLFIAWQIYLVDRSSLPSENIFGPIHGHILPLTLLTALMMVAVGFYHRKVFFDYRVFVCQALLLCVALTLLVVVLWYVFYNSEFGPHSSLLGMDWRAVTIWLACICLTRLVFGKIAYSELLKRRVLVLGAGKKAAHIAALTTSSTISRTLPVAYLSAAAGQKLVPATSVDAVNTDSDLLRGWASHFNVSEIVVAEDERRGLPIDALLRCRAAGIKVIDYLDFIERETKTVDLAALQPSWLVFSDGFRKTIFTDAVKRILDVVLSLAVLLATLPLMLLTALLIKLESAGTIFFRQQRVGLNGRVFVLFKFRSMQVDAEKDGGARWATVRDPRVTKVGRLIRKLRIDELPQLFNVLLGHMSFVGPRPERPQFVAGFESAIPFYPVRHNVKPGITGWAQINYPYGASEEDARKKLEYDLYYVKNRGLFLDLLIVLQTVRVILWADGAR